MAKLDHKGALVDGGGADERKRKYNSLSAGGADITPEEMEAYRRKKLLSEDPMLKFMSQKDSDL